MQEKRKPTEATNSEDDTSIQSSMSRQLTNLELIRKAESYIDELKLEKAVALLDEGIRRFPNDTLIIDQYTDLLIQLGEHGKAKEVRLTELMKHLVD